MHDLTITCMFHKNPGARTSDELAKRLTDRRTLDISIL